MSRQREVRAAGLEWTVVESIPVHEVIKRGRPADKVRFSSQIESNTSEDATFRGVFELELESWILESLFQRRMLKAP